MTAPLSEPWVSLLAWKHLRLRRGLVAEARREMTAGHELHGRIDTAIARCTGCDDVVFRLKTDTGFALVHLTWSGKPEPPPLPRTILLPSFIALEIVLDQHQH
jgi:hypothetical protein